MLSRKFRKKARETILLVILILGTLLFQFFQNPILDTAAEYLTLTDQGQFVLNAVDVYDTGTKPIEINGNKPLFTVSGDDKNSYEDYSSLDFLGRCGPADALLGKDLMPTDGREDIGSVKPSGWNNQSYPDAAAACAWDQKYWANRCHLIAFALAGENANDKNLITGTRTMNLNMLEYELELIDYIRSTGNHVRYRVTPVYAGAELVARGVLMEAYSIEDNGSICFCVWVPNTQDCLQIDYRTGNTETDY